MPLFLFFLPFGCCLESNVTSSDCVVVVGVTDQARIHGGVPWFLFATSVHVWSGELVHRPLVTQLIRASSEVVQVQLMIAWWRNSSVCFTSSGLIISQSHHFSDGSERMNVSRLFVIAAHNEKRRQFFKITGTCVFRQCYLVWKITRGCSHIAWKCKGSCLWRP